MVFEKIIKSQGRGSVVEPNEVRLNVNSVVFGKDINLGAEYVEIYLDKELGRVGFKSTGDSSSGFKIYTQSRVSSRLTNLGFLKQINSGIFKVKQENGMYVVEGVEFV